MVKEKALYDLLLTHLMASSETCIGENSSLLILLFEICHHTIMAI